MSTGSSTARQPKLFNAFVLVGDVLWLQILFVLFCLPVITLFPAAVALQRTLQAVMVEHKPRSTTIFWTEFVWALKRTWKVSIFLPVFVFAAFVSLVFWMSAHTTAGTLVLCLLIPLYGAAMAAYLSVLASVMTASSYSGLRDWCQSAFALAGRRALVLASSIIVMATWFLLLGKVPTLVLIGTGLVPAALAWWIASPLLLNATKKAS